MKTVKIKLKANLNFYKLNRNESAIYVNNFFF